MNATKHQSVFTVLGEYKGVFRKVLRTPQTLYTGAIMLILNICLMINGHSGLPSHREPRRLRIPIPEPGALPVRKIRDHAGVLFLWSSRACAGCISKFRWCWVCRLVLSQLLLITIPATKLWAAAGKHPAGSLQHGGGQPVGDQMTVRPSTRKSGQDSINIICRYHPAYIPVRLDRRNTV